jgi:saccharopine dehydrogenase-like NADP-dependent oxidoreductase
MNLWAYERGNKRKLRKWHTEELHNLYSSQNIIALIISRTIRWDRHVEHMAEMSSA